LTVALWRRATAELLGVYILVVAGCGAIAVDSLTGTLSHGGIALSFGLAVLVAVAATGHLSGAHLNPAVTVAFASWRHFPWPEVPVYVAGHLGGAILAAWTLKALFGARAGLGATIPAGSVWQALGMEVLLTAVLMFVITSVATDSRAVGEMAAVAIGGTVSLNALWGGPVSGAAMNPARSFGPALAAGNWGSHWIYWLGPIAGALLGAGAYEVVRGPGRGARRSVEPSGGAPSDVVPLPGPKIAGHVPSAGLESKRSRREP
jgi:aquaporin NIP